MDRIENEYVKLWLDDGVIFLLFKPELKLIDVMIAKKIVDDRLRISNGKTMPLYIDLNDLVAVDKPAREFLAGEESVRYLSAAAILIGNPVILLVARLFLVINQPRLKIELFYNKEKAFDWLNRYKT